ncbi:MAG TPA: MBL fold metallo-hydrolase [Nitrosopumilaceae archaeon]|nr:MBL fold metallo-hydrolase [Nitrosopumilaceae archaeon]
MTSRGILVRQNDRQVHLDPKRAASKGVSFVSHAHIDHLHRQNGGLVLTSKPTSEIAKLRGYSMDDFVEEFENFSMIDAGHILGARGLLFDDIFYTGDICTRERGFLKGAKVPQCKTLITESTFGLPEFVFPRIDETVKKVNGIISEMYSKGIPVILHGYELGKAQTLSSLFGHWEPLYYHDSVKQINDLHRIFGIDLKDSMGHTAAEKMGLLAKKPWVMIAPSMSGKSNFVKYMKSKYGVITIGFSGWAKSNRYSFARQHDYSIVLSDHCDYNDLVDLVKKAKPEKVYTVHGFVDEFAKELVKLGFDAQPLRESSLDDYF